jgi:prevent-host-death family protein
LVAVSAGSGHIGHVRKTSLAEAKAHLSELVDEAEHRGRRTMILRHGKPAAAIVPVEVAAPRRRARKTWTEEDARRSVRAFIAEFSAAEPEVSAVEDLLATRR